MPDNFLLTVASWIVVSKPKSTSFETAIAHASSGLTCVSNSSLTVVASRPMRNANRTDSTASGINSVRLWAKLTAVAESWPMHKPIIIVEFLLGYSSSGRSSYQLLQMLVSWRKGVCQGHCSQDSPDKLAQLNYDSHGWSKTLVVWSAVICHWN